MPSKTQILIIAAAAAIAMQSASAQSGKMTGAGSPNTQTTKTLRAAAEALGMLRWSDIGSGDVHLPAVDVVNSMEIWGSGTIYDSGQSYKTDYHAALGYNPPAMRVELTHSGGGAPGHTIQVVSNNFAWDESEIGGGLVPGKGTASPVAGAAKGRLVQLWILPYGVVKAALAAGDKTKITTENGATILTFPLSGQLAGLTVKAMLNEKNEVTKVETLSDNPALGAMVMEAEYSNYADHGEILTDVKSPGHIVEKQGGQTVLDIEVKKVDANNPYLVFPVPENVKKATAR